MVEANGSKSITRPPIIGSQLVMRLVFAAFPWSSLIRSRLPPHSVGALDSHPLRTSPRNTANRRKYFNSARPLAGTASSTDHDLGKLISRGETQLNPSGNRNQAASAYQHCVMHKQQRQQDFTNFGNARRHLPSA
jgi:hypothetical protein